ncbi:HdeD family acid-resistance protein [Orbaceae bacterium ESL0721]|nr:HdeD family acid-resistance protein [Orbaceae bacterium ESL0721]
MNTELQSFDTVRTKSNGFIAVGIILIILGVLALCYQFVATVFSVYFIGSLLFIAGIAQVYHSFQIKGFGYTALWAVLGVLYVVTGLLAFIEPIAVSSALTLVICFLLILSGVTQLIAAFNNRAYPRWGWWVFSGFITLLLGILIIAGWPANSLWVLGMFLGIDLIFQGWAYLTIGCALKRH